eukprot:4691365-Pleurochrysis_carterae.AAC.1
MRDEGGAGAWAHGTARGSRRDDEAQLDADDGPDGRLAGAPACAVALDRAHARWFVAHYARECQGEDIRGGARARCDGGSDA